MPVSMQQSKGQRNGYFSLFSSKGEKKKEIESGLFFLLAMKEWLSCFIAIFFISLLSSWHYAKYWGLYMNFTVFRNTRLAILHTDLGSQIHSSSINSPVSK